MLIANKTKTRLLKKIMNGWTGDRCTCKNVSLIHTYTYFLHTACIYFVTISWFELVFSSMLLQILTLDIDIAYWFK